MARLRGWDACSTVAPTDFESQNSLDVPPHKPEGGFDDPEKLRQLAGRLGWGFANTTHLVAGVGAETGEGRVRQEQERQAAREREERGRQYEMDKAAMQGDIAACNAELGDSQFVELTKECWQKAGKAGLPPGNPGAALMFLLNDPQCRQMFIESYKRICEDVTRLTGHDVSMGRERFERMDRTNADMERLERIEHTA